MDAPGISQVDGSQGSKTSGEDYRKELLSAHENEKDAVCRQRPVTQALSQALLYLSISHHGGVRIGNKTEVSPQT